MNIHNYLIIIDVFYDRRWRYTNVKQSLTLWILIKSGGGANVNDHYLSVKIMM